MNNYKERYERTRMEIMQAEFVNLRAHKADAERYDYLLTRRLGWLSRRAPLPWGKQTMKEAMSAAIDAARKEE